MEVITEIMIPQEAVGRIIGTKGAHIAMLRTIPGMVSCTLKETALNAQTLRLKGTQDAVNQAAADVTSVILRAQRELGNRMREHSWTLTDDGRMRTPREVHQTGKSAPRPHLTGVGSNHYAARKQGKRFDKEAERADQLRRDAGMIGHSRDRDGRKGGKSGRGSGGWDRDEDD